MTKEQLLLQYKKSLKSFCKEYRSFYIPASQNVEELQENNQNKGISLTNIFTPLSVVPLEESRIGKQNLTDDVDFDVMVREIDRKIYHLELEERKVSADAEVTEAMFPIFLRAVKKEDLELNRAIFQYSNGPLDPEIHELLVDVADSVLKDYKENTIYLLRGAYIHTLDGSYFLLEPEELKRPESEKKEEEKEPELLISGKIILSSPGGGKTTLLQMLTYSFLDHYMLPKLSGDDSETYGKMKEMLGSGFGLFPVFIRIRDLAEELLVGTEETPDFETMIIWALKSFTDIEGEEIIWQEVLREIQETSRLALLIDGIDEMEYGKQQQFLQELKTYLEQNQKHMVYMTARYANYKDNQIEQLLRPVYINEYMIESLSSNYPLIETFAKNWYSCVFAHDKKKQKSVENAFLRPIKNDPNLLKLITNPLELTNLLIISSGEGYLPTDRNQIYEGAIELQLKWNHIRSLDPVDVEFQLAYLAYQMSESVNERIIIGESRLIDIICEAREELKRYFRTPQPVDRDDIKDFVQYLVGNTCILQRSITSYVAAEPQYEFHHLQYQAFLTAFCITKGLFAKKRRKSSKFDYLKNYLDKSDDCWNQVIVLAAMQDIHLRDDIIENLLELSCENKRQNQSVAMLLQLMAVPGINFDSEEKSKVASLLVEEGTNRLELLRSKKEDIQWMLFNNTAEENREVIRILLNPTRVQDEKYLNNVSGILFFVIWECKVEESEIRRVMETCFKNWITMDIITQIKNTIARNSENQNTIDVIFKMGKENLISMDGKEQKATDYYLLISVMHYFLEEEKGEKDPYQVMRVQILSENVDQKAIGINLLFLLAWMQMEQRQSLLNAPRTAPADVIEEVRQVILQGIRNDDYMTRDFEVTYRDLALAHIIDRGEEAWYTEDIFQIQCKKLCQLEQIKGDEYAIGILSSYPINKKNLEMGSRQNIPKSTIEKLEMCFETAKDDVKMRIFQILTLLNLEREGGDLAQQFELLKSKLRINWLSPHVKMTVTQKKLLLQLHLQVGEYYLQENKFYKGGGMSLEDAKEHFEEASLIGEAEKDAYSMIKDALQKTASEKHVSKELVELLWKIQEANNFADAALWWKALLDQGEPEGARVINALHYVIPELVTKRDFIKSRSLLLMQDELKDSGQRNRVFEYRTSEGEMKQGELIWDYVDSRTGNSYMLYQRGMNGEHIEVSVSRYEWNGDEVVLLPEETERDEWACKIIYDWVRIVLDE